MVFYILGMLDTRKAFFSVLRNKQTKNIPMVVPAGLISLGNNSSPSGQVTDNLSGSLIENRHINVEAHILKKLTF